MEEKVVCSVQIRPSKSLVIFTTALYVLYLQLDPNSIDLSYYNDRSMKEKRGTINLNKFIGIRPNAKIGHKENVFAIETEERKFILRAGDQRIKNIWLAKLCEFCGQGNPLCIA